MGESAVGLTGICLKTKWLLLGTKLKNETSQIYVRKFGKNKGQNTKNLIHKQDRQ